LGFVAFALGVAPVHTGIALGNPSVVVLIFCGYALYFARRSDAAASGVLLALAFCLKPPAATAAVVLLLLYGRARTILTFFGASCLIVSGTVIIMLHIDPLWRADYRDNLAQVLGHNGAADFAAGGLGRFDLVNLQAPLYTLFQSALAANVVAFSIAATLAAIWLVLFRRGRKLGTSSYWLAAGTLGLISLLPIYQRNYNCGVILFVAVWAFSNIREPGARASLLVSIPFLVPGEAMLRRSAMAPEISGSTLWTLLLMSQITWSILAVIVISLTYMAQRSAAEGVTHPKIVSTKRAAGE
jgi:hypothetical protein